MIRGAGRLLRLAGFGCLLFGATRCSQPGTDSTGTGGTTGVGGATGEGGATGSGTGGATANGGATGAGGMTGAGGAATAAGGRTGTGGSTGAGGSAVGTGGATAAGGSTGEININDIVPGLDGFYWEATPSGNTALSGTNYPFGPAAGGCPRARPGTRPVTSTTRCCAVKGTTGQKYTININVRGVAGTRCYTGGTPASTATPNPSGPNNTWYVGGKQFNDSIWNTYEIHVAPAVPNAANVYFANSFPNVSNWCQKEASYEVRYNASFPVLGGGNITFTIHDTNCRTLANCGAAEAQATCNTATARTIDMSGVSPAPTNFGQPRTVSLGGTTYDVQWLWIDVTSVTSP